MPYIRIAPNLKIEIADVVRRHRKLLADWPGRFGSRARHEGADRYEAGRFTTAGQAEVSVEAVLDYRVGYIYNPPNSANSQEERRIHVSAEAKCHGYGCVEPDFDQGHGPYFLLADDADVTAEALVPLVQAAREWAQEHAEKCRAQPYTGR
jgi:hypothetical protein